MTDTLPLFPLGTVLFPGVVLPLHVFEPRYRQLVADLLAGGGRPPGSGDDRAPGSGDDGAPGSGGDRAPEFGVVGIRQGWEVGADGVTALYRVGCTAVVREVTRYEDGRCDLLATGRRRFRLDAVDTGSRPYLQGEVSWLPDSVGAADEAAVLARGVGVVFTRCVRLLRAPRRDDDAGDEDDAGAGLDVALPDDPLLLSYLVAAVTPLPLEDRQDLLAAPDAVSRLRRELRLLKREATMVTLLRAVPVPLASLRVPMSPN